MMKRSILLGLMCVTALLMFSACPAKEAPETTDSGVMDTGATSTTGTATTSDQSIVADFDFAATAAEGGMAEVELSQVAVSKATHADVKMFAQKMVADHGRANDELRQLAASRSLTLPASLNAEHQQVRDKLNTLSGAELDREYMKGMVADHTRTVADFENEASSGSDADMKNWASNKLPTLREHKQMAEDLATKVGAGSNPGSTP